MVGVQAMVGPRATAGVQAMVGPRATAGVQAMVGLQATAGVQAMVGLRATAGVQAMVDLRATAGVQAIVGPRATAGVQAIVGPRATAGVQAMVGPRAMAGVRTMARVHRGRIPNPLPSRADHRSRSPSVSSRKSLRTLVRVEGGWGVRAIPSPFIKIYERGRDSPYPPAFGLLLPRNDFFAGLYRLAPVHDAVQQQAGGRSRAVD